MNFGRHNAPWEERAYRRIQTAREQLGAAALSDEDLALRHRAIVRSGDGTRLAERLAVEEALSLRGWTVRGEELFRPRKAVG